MPDPCTVTPALCQFVAEIAASPTVVLDLNDLTKTSGLRIAAPGVNLTPPELRRAVSSTMLRDGELVSASAYANRVIRIPLTLANPTNDTSIAAARNLLKQLNKPVNTLRIRIGTTDVFFRTLRSSLALAMARNLLRDGAATIELPAEPFGYGEEQTIGLVTITSDPAATGVGVNPTYVDITGVKGDVPSPVIITHANGTAGLWDTTYVPGALTCVYAIRRHGTPGNVTWFKQAESFVLGVGTLGTNDAMFSPSGGNNSVLYTPGGTSQVMVFEGAMFSNAPNADMVGTYRVFANVRTTVSTDAFYAQLKWGQGTASEYDRYVNPEVFVHIFPYGGPNNFTTSTFLVDLGLISVGNPVGYGPKVSSVRTANSPFLSFWARRSAGGTGNLQIDYLLYVPADEALAIAQYPTWVALYTDSGGVTGMGEIADAVNDIAYVTDNAKWPADQGMATLIGRIPDLYPDVTNRLFIVPGLGRNNQRDRTWQATVSYFPRYLIVPGATA